MCGNRTRFPTDQVNQFRGAGGANHFPASRFKGLDCNPCLLSTLGRFPAPELCSDGPGATPASGGGLTLSRGQKAFKLTPVRLRFAIANSSVSLLPRRRQNSVNTPQSAANAAFAATGRTHLSGVCGIYRLHLTQTSWRNYGTSFGTQTPFIHFSAARVSASATIHASYDSNSWLIIPALNIHRIRTHVVMPPSPPIPLPMRLPLEGPPGETSTVLSALGSGVSPAQVTPRSPGLSQP